MQGGVERKEDKAVPTCAQEAANFVTAQRAARTFLRPRCIRIGGAWPGPAAVQQFEADPSLVDLLRQALAGRSGSRRGKPCGGQTRGARLFIGQQKRFQGELAVLDGIGGLLQRR